MMVKEADMVCEVHRIMVKTDHGVVFEVFRWRGRAQEGIARAKKEGPDFGVVAVEVWAEPG